jgi:hypothetical protein
MFLFYKAMWKESHRVASVEMLRAEISKKFTPIDQHDAHEFLLYLVQNL